MTVRQADVGCLSVQRQVGLCRPDVLGSNRGHLLELGFSEGGSMDDGSRAVEQALLLEHIEFCARAIIEPSAKCTTKDLVLFQSTLPLKDFVSRMKVRIWPARMPSSL
jgi:hypothetical protein